MNYSILLQNGITPKQIERNGMISYVDINNVGKINELLKNYGLKPTTSYDLVDLRLYTMTLEEIQKRLDLLKDNHLLDLCYGNIENLVFNTEVLVSRINECKDNNIPFKDQNGYYSFLFNTKEYDNLGLKKEEKKEIDNKNEQEDNDLIRILNDPTVKFTGFDEDTFFKYQSLCEYAKSLLDEMPFIDYDNTIANLACLLKVPTNASDEELLKTAIIYNSDLNSEEKSIIESRLVNKESGLSL